MTSKKIHIVSLIPVAILTVILGYHPIYWFPLLGGVLLPEVDAVSPRLHRSWIFHTFLIPALLYQICIQSRLNEEFSVAVLIIHFITVGMMFHFLFDFVYPKNQTHNGAEWPVRPTIFSDPWGLMWLGLSWAFQWFAYLSNSFIPWLFGI